MRLPRAYRSLPRPSSPPRAKASTVRLFALDLKSSSCCFGWIPLHHVTRLRLSKSGPGPARAGSRQFGTEIGEVRNRGGRLKRPFVRRTARSTRRSRKEVIQPQVPLRLPCYDFAPVTELTLDGCALAVRPPASGPSSFHGVTGGVYKARERIHRSVLICDY